MSLRWWERSGRSSVGYERWAKGFVGMTAVWRFVLLTWTCTAVEGGFEICPDVVPPLSFGHFPRQRGENGTVPGGSPSPLDPDFRRDDGGFALGLTSVVPG